MGQRRSLYLFGTGVCIDADCRSVWPAEGEESPWEDGGDGTISYSEVNVGIGTTSPATLLDVHGIISLNGQTFLQLDDGNTFKIGDLGGGDGYVATLHLRTNDENRLNEELNNRVNQFSLGDRS